MEQKNDGRLMCTALHSLMAFGPSDSQMASLEVLLQHGSNPLALTEVE
eukprot:CAMPEP_0119027880 /NCGR_PEP_ID=MMETSP1176-20130426/37921_1 /TAXON_ID=265551 /ORGANISM="Synedropsis recta cf, Strain CCMP1620" /LENGTH=47 /DNA_ID= /DNA_START= /DNA_END= /DNA_ORIENTATION=